MKKIFICYSHYDEDIKNKLIAKLRTLEDVGDCIIWQDRLINAGEQWIGEIQKELNEANIFVLLISEYFISSEFINKHEIPVIFERKKNKENIKIIPIIIRPCLWNKVKWLNSMQVLPKDGSPVMTGEKNDIEEKIFEISRYISDLIENKDKPVNIIMNHLKEIKNKKITKIISICIIFIFFSVTLYINYKSYESIKKYNKKIQYVELFTNKPFDFSKIIITKKMQIEGLKDMTIIHKYYKEDRFYADSKIENWEYKHLSEFDYNKLIADKTSTNNIEPEIKKMMKEAKLHLWRSNKEYQIKNFNGLSCIFPHIIVQRIGFDKLMPFNYLKNIVEFMFINHLAIELKTSSQNKNKFIYNLINPTLTLEANYNILHFRSSSILKNVIINDKHEIEFYIRKEILFIPVKKTESFYLIEIINPKNDCFEDEYLLNLIKKWFLHFRILE